MYSEDRPTSINWKLIYVGSSSEYIQLIDVGSSSDTFS
jgi:hypothetical protein